MHSSLPKPLHRLCGRPMVAHVIDSLADLDVDRVVVVVGHGADQVIKTVTHYAPPGINVDFVEQRVQRGTGDATMVALTAFTKGHDNDDVVVLPGDTPLLRPASLVDLVATHRSREAGVTLLTADLADPTGYGRIVRGNDGRVARVVEHIDASDEQREIHEVNTSIYCFQRNLLSPSLRRLGTQNAQGELYLTDVVEFLFDAGYTTHSMTVADSVEAAGVNDRAQLAVAEAELRGRINVTWMRRGVTMWDPERTYVDASVHIEPDVVLLPGTMLRGTTSVGSGSEIGPNAILEDVAVGAKVTIGTVHVRHVTIGDGATIDSFSVVTPGTVIAGGARVEATGSLTQGN